MKNTAKPYDPFEVFAKYAVEANNLRDFIEQYQKPGTVTASDHKADYEKHKKDIERDGFTIIPKESSVTGDIVSYYGKI